MDQNTIENTNFEVSTELNETRLDVFIFQMCDFLPSRSFAAKLIKKGAVLVNGKMQKSSYALKTNDVVNVNLSFLHETLAAPKAELIPLDIIYEDAHIIVLNKPAGLVVHPGSGVFNGTLVNALLAHCGSLIPSLGNPDRAGIVHRLDRDTSGVMVAAKTQLALTVLSQQFADHSHTRIYHAICYGIFNEKAGYIETGYGRDPHNRIKYKTFPLGEGKRAALSYKVLKEFSHLGPAVKPRDDTVKSQGDIGGAFSLVECTLETGRTHQIRVQMSSLKHPLVGDALYGYIPGQIQNNKQLLALIKQYIKRQLLHAIELHITHPETQERLKFTAPYPADFVNILNQFNEQLSSSGLPAA